MVRAIKRMFGMGCAAVKLWLYFIGGGVIAAYVASIAAKSIFGPLL
jgi:hypothetical protein